MNAEQFAEFLTATQRPRARRPEVFESGDGTEWLTWRRNFLILIELNGWTGGEGNDQQQRRRTRAKREARASIKGQADLMVADIQPADNDETVAAFLNRLQARFLPAAESNFAKVNIAGEKKIIRIGRGPRIPT